jgi:Tfp pilus assembly protein PilF
MSPPMLRRPTIFIYCALLIGGGAACRRTLTVPDATYRETVSAFYTALAAMQTTQEALAREKLERVTTLVPGEPAGWANLGLLLLRQGELDAAGERLARAEELAPKAGEIQRLLGLLESRKGRLPEAVRHWRRALALDAEDARAAFALAQDLERQGADAEAEAQQALGSLVERTGNLAARLEYARLAAKRGDAESLRRAVAPLEAASRNWPAPAQEQWDALRQAATGDPRTAATRVVFLKNVLVRLPEYRHALAQLSAPRAEAGEPLVRFLALRNPDPRPAAADEGLTFGARPAGVDVAGPAWVGAIALGGDGAPVVGTATEREARIGAASVPLPRGGPAGSDGLLAADLDYDYRTDIVVAGPGGTAVLRQGEDGRFADVTAAAQLDVPLASAAARGAWAADVDTDGDLDVVLALADGAPAVLRNNGDGTFAVRRPFDGVTRLRGFAWADLDGEGVPDAALLEDAGTVRVFLNIRGGDLQERELPSGVPKAVAIAAAEANGDSLFDLLLLTAEGKVVRVGQASGGRDWEVAEVARLDGPPPGLVVGSSRLVVADLDNNGAADLIVSDGKATRVLLRGPDAWKVLPSSLPLDVRAAADIDGDGRLELIGLGVDGRAALAAGRGTKAYHWQAVRPRSATATGDQRINSFGIGGEVEIRSGLHVQKQVIASPVVHFGLGEAERGEIVRVIWPNGIIQSEFDARGDAAIAATQRLKGSCPWLFAWNGREMAFVTDLIWRSPLGLRINAQATADVLMTEDWVKVRGDQLVPSDGVYDMRVTAELWETHFFDRLSLLVADHPPGTEVFVDERFAVPPPPLGVVVTGPVGTMREVRNDRGEDVSETVRAIDGRHLDFAGRGRYQGVTRDHFVEMELPEEAPRAGPLWLLARGWIHPTDSSINVALGQGSHEPPRGLSLHVADAAGRFREVRRGLGFPSGKDKTILVDLTGLFPRSGPRRVRLATNLEIFWDRLGWAAGRPDVRIEPRALPLAFAELRYRGYSVTEQPDPGSPERPRYVLAGTMQHWRDLAGYYTRFGDVRELLGETDDRYVIMNAGDEMRLRFSAAPAPAPGMVRDFVMIGDGWVKDGDYNTSFSRTVLPLPTHATGRYDRTPGLLEDDPVYRRQRSDFDRYHTRYVAGDDARDALRTGPRP